MQNGSVTPFGFHWRLAACVLAASLLAACSSQKDQAASALHFFKRGNQAYAEEDYARAIRLYTQAIALDDRSPALYFNLGLTYFRVDANEEAVKAYSKALKLDPAFAEAQLNLALAYDRLYNAEAARAAYNAYQDLVRGQKQAGEPGKAQTAADGARADAPSAGAVAAAKAAVRAQLTGAGKAAAAPAKEASRPQRVSSLPRFDDKKAQSGGATASRNPSNNARQGGDSAWETQEPARRSR
jgi:tetratricopeptide (TPR) repeat protein